MQQGLLGALLLLSTRSSLSKKNAVVLKQHGQKAKQKQPPLAPIQTATRTSQHLSSLWMHGRCCVFLLSLHICIYLTYDYYDVEFFWCQHVPLPLSYSAVQILPLQFFVCFQCFKFVGTMKTSMNKSDVGSYCGGQFSVTLVSKCDGQFWTQTWPPNFKSGYLGPFGGPAFFQKWKGFGRCYSHNLCFWTTQKWCWRNIFTKIQSLQQGSREWSLNILAINHMMLSTKLEKHSMSNRLATQNLLDKHKL